MTMKIGCCTTIEHYHALAEAGYDTITLAGRDLAAMTDAQFHKVQTLAALGRLQLCSVNAFCAPELRLNGPGWDINQVRAYTDLLCQRAGKLGIRFLGIGSPGSRSIPEGYSVDKALRELGISLAAIAAAAGNHGMEVLLEAVSTLEGNCITTTRQALELVKRLSLPNLHLVYDLYHALMMNEPPSDIREAFAHIRGVHICRAEQGGRYYLAEGCLAPYKPYLDMLLSLGFDGELALEAFDGDVREGIRTSYRILTRYLETSPAKPK